MIFVEKGSLKNWNMLKWGLRELLRDCEKGVLRAAHPRTHFQGEYPPRKLYPPIIQMLFGTLCRHMTPSSLFLTAAFQECCQHPPPQRWCSEKYWGCNQEAVFCLAPFTGGDYESLINVFAYIGYVFLALWSAFIFVIVMQRDWCWLT